MSDEKVAAGGPAKNAGSAMTLAVSRAADGVSHSYLVLKVMNGTSPLPGDTLSDDDVATLVADPNWNVTIVLHINPVTTNMNITL